MLALLVPLFLSTLLRLTPEPPQDASIVVLSIELNNLHKTQPDSAFPGRIHGLATALRSRLARSCGYRLLEIDSVAEASARRGQGYFYDHPDVAAGLAARVGADWVVVPRLNRASAWASDLQAHLIRVADSAIVNTRIVELKGLELDPDLAARLESRGAAWMADQLSQALELAVHPGQAPARRCPPNAP